MLQNIDSEMDFFKRLPKVELHAHLNGSIGPALLKRLVDEHEHQPSDSIQKDDVILKKLLADESDLMTLDECFQAFKCIHRVSGDETAVRLIVRDVISSFAADGVVYVELRTTPRAEPSSGMTKRSYLKTVLDEIRSSERDDSKAIHIRLLVSIDRRKGVQDALDTLALVEELRDEYGGLIVGIDVSGDPSIGNLLDYVGVLEKARSGGLKVAVHLAEIPNVEEVGSFLKAFLPDRIGHGTCLTAARGGLDEIEKMVIENRIPLELCPSSNVIGQTVGGYSDHHFNEWGPSSRNHPIAICTDDMGVFKTSLSKEYALIGRHFMLTHEQIWKMARESVDLTFADDDLKSLLRKKFVS